MRILFATGNENKIAEAREVFEPLGHTVEGLIIDGQRPNFDEPKDLGIEAVAEAKISQALALIEGSELQGSAILVEDSGIFLDAFPEWPGAESSDVERDIGLEGIIQRVNQSGERGTEYRAVAILSSENQVWKSQGVCRGTISNRPLGSNGFGYDPIFIPDEGDGRTFGELSNEVKNQISHRKKVMEGLSNLLKSPSR
ncbi:MAG: non-canonical purine NTP pyrophosphatase [Candidatus Thermoplasmatota archaeon]|nr:non-canonical purine NTP pyrophosphatase [Candidatus Thermoplasmatota archaeon]